MLKRSYIHQLFLNTVVINVIYLDIRVFLCPNIFIIKNNWWKRLQIYG